jgi:AraC-like DNA-binding protein
MTQQIATRRGVVLYEHNPFMSDVGVKTKTRKVMSRKGDMMLVSSETGEIKSQIAGFWEAEEVDPTKFVKLFVNGVKALAELTNAGTRVFELLYTEMQEHVGKDVVYLSYSASATALNISRSTFSRGLKELIEKRFLAAQPGPGLYWVNPDFIWNGDRLTFVKEYRRTTNKKNLIDERQHALPLE